MKHICPLPFAEPTQPSSDAIVVGPALPQRFSRFQVFRSPPDPGMICGCSMYVAVKRSQSTALQHSVCLRCNSVVQFGTDIDWPAVVCFAYNLDPNTHTHTHTHTHTPLSSYHQALCRAINPPQERVCSRHRHPVAVPKHPIACAVSLLGLCSGPSLAEGTAAHTP